MSPAKLKAHAGGFPRWRVGLAFLAATAFAQEPVRRYDLPGGEATDALREFARASGLQLLFPERAIRGTELPPLRGEFAADEALQQLLAESGLEAVSDPTTGAYAVRRRVAVPSRAEVMAPEKRPRAAVL